MKLWEDEIRELLDKGHPAEAIKRIQAQIIQTAGHGKRARMQDWINQIKRQHGIK